MGGRVREWLGLKSIVTSGGGGAAPRSRSGAPRAAPAIDPSHGRAVLWPKGASLAASAALDARGGGGACAATSTWSVVGVGVRVRVRVRVSSP